MSHSLLLVGRDGNGKSSTGNSILCHKLFTPTSNCLPEQVVIQQKDKEGVCVTEIAGLEYPGSDQSEKIEETLKTIEKTIEENTTGFNAVIFVMKYGVRFTKQEKDCLLMIKSIFGSNVIKDFGVIVMTCGDIFDLDCEENKETFEEWCQGQTGDVRTLFDDCQNRCVLFNNRTTDLGRMEKQREKLFSMVAKIAHPYTLGEYKKAVKNQTDILVKSKLPKYEEWKNRKMGEVWNQLNKAHQEYSQGCLDFGGLVSILNFSQQNLLHLKKTLLDEDKNTGILEKLLFDVPIAEMRIHTQLQMAEKRLLVEASEEKRLIISVDLQSAVETVSIRECSIDGAGNFTSRFVSDKDVSGGCTVLVKICKMTPKSHDSQASKVFGTYSQETTIQGQDSQATDIQGHDSQTTVIQGHNLQATATQGHNLQATAIQGHNLQATAPQGHDLQATAIQGHNLQATATQGHDLQATAIQGNDSQATAIQGHDLQATVIQGHDLQAFDIQGHDSQTTMIDSHDSQTTVIQGHYSKTTAIQGDDSQANVFQGQDSQTTEIQGHDLQATVIQGQDSQSTVIQGQDSQSTVIQGQDSQSTVIQGQDSQSTVIQGQDSQSTVIQGQDSQSTVIQGQDSQSTVIQGQDSQSTVIQGHDLQATAIQGHNLQATVIQGNDSQATAIQGHDLQATVIQGHDLQAFDIQGHDSQTTMIDSHDSQTTVIQGHYSKTTAIQGDDSQANVFQGQDSQTTEIQGHDLQATVIQGQDSQSTVIQGQDSQSTVVLGPEWEVVPKIQGQDSQSTVVLGPEWEVVPKIQGSDSQIPDHDKPNGDHDSRKIVFQTISKILVQSNCNDLICVISNYEQTFTKQEIDVLMKKIQATCGTKKVKDHSILILICDQYNLEIENYQMFEKWHKEETSANQYLFSECGERYVLLNPWVKDEGTLIAQKLRFLTLIHTAAGSYMKNASKKAKVCLNNAKIVGELASPEPVPEKQWYDQISSKLSSWWNSKKPK